MGGKPTGGLDSGDPDDNIMLIVLIGQLYISVMIIDMVPLYIEIFNARS